MTTRAMVTTVNSVSAIIAITVAMTTPATKDVTSALGGVVVATEDSGKQETVTADNINNVLLDFPYDVYAHTCRY